MYKKHITDRDMVLNIVSHNLKMLRVQKFPNHGGMKKCAEALGLKIQQWSPWENGKRLPSTIRLEKIASFFNTTIEYLRTDHRHSQRKIGKSSDAILHSQTKKYENIINTETEYEFNENMVASIGESLKIEIEKNLKTALCFKNAKAILKLEFSVVDVKIVT